VPGISGSLRLASLLGTQLPVPLGAGPRALITNSLAGATARAAFSFTNTQRAGCCAPPATQRTRPSHGNQIAGPLFQW
jgi:hypothetical protein